VKIPTGILCVICVLAVVYALAGLFWKHLMTATSVKAPTCLVFLGSTTSEQNGVTTIIAV